MKYRRTILMVKDLWKRGGQYYTQFSIQPSQFINENKILFAEGNVIKYICRHRGKNGREDLEKAKHYIDMIIERDYEKETI